MYFRFAIFSLLISLFMPFSPELLAAGAAGANLLGTGINAFSTSGQNKKSRQFALDMYNRQVQDQLGFWNLQNTYNDPLAQMNRLKRAGLNPNLVYGNGSAVNTADSIRTPDVQTPQFRTPEWGNMVSAAGTGFMDFVDLQIKQAQYDNLLKQGDVIAQDSALKAAQVDATLAGTEETKFDISKKQDLRSISLEAAAESLRQTKTNTDIAIDRNVREAALASSSVAEAAERILDLRAKRPSYGVERTKMRAETDEIRQRIENMKKDGTLKDFDIELRNAGINPHDPLWARVVGIWLSKQLGINYRTGEVGKSNFEVKKGGDNPMQFNNSRFPSLLQQIFSNH